MGTEQLFALALIGTVFFGCIMIGALCVHFAAHSISIGSTNNFKSVVSIQRSYDKIRKRTRVPCSVIYIKVTSNASNSLNNDVRAVYRFLTQSVLETFGKADNLISQHEQKGFIVLTRLSELQLNDCVQQLSCAVRVRLDNMFYSRKVKLHFGAYLMPASDVDFEEAVARAMLASDQAEIKNAIYIAWDYNLQRRNEQAQSLDNSFKRGLEENNFFLEFQPVVDLESGNVVGGEVLTKLNNDASVILSPGIFLPVINNNDLDDSFDFFVFDKFCKWSSLHLDLLNSVQYISVNFSRKTISKKNFAERIINIASKYKVPYDHIAIEVLEDLPDDVVELDIMAENLKKLKEVKIHIFLDDFGNCSMHFNDLSLLSLDVLKIDRPIIKNTNTEAGARIFRSVLNIAKELNVSVVCEGVEEIEQIEFLKKHKCKYVQGFYFYHPMRPDQFEKLLVNNQVNNVNAR